MMKVDELTGAELDYWVAKSEGLKVHIDETVKPATVMECKGGHYREQFQPLSCDWSFIGPIIERDNIHITQYKDGTPMRTITYFARDGWSEYKSNIMVVPLLDAIKRCIVKRKYGEEVESASA